MEQEGDLSKGKESLDSDVADSMAIAALDVLENNNRFIPNKLAPFMKRLTSDNRSRFLEELRSIAADMLKNSANPNVQFEAKPVFGYWNNIAVKMLIALDCSEELVKAGVSRVDDINRFSIIAVDAMARAAVAAGKRLQHPDDSIYSNEEGVSDQLGEFRKKKVESEQKHIP